MVKIILSVIMFVILIEAAELSFSGNLNGTFDNRESRYGPGPSETFFGTDLYVGANIAIDSFNSVYGGVSFLSEFGSTKYSGAVTPLIYYRFRNSKQKFIFGSFDRDENIPLSEFLISIPYKFNNPLAEGFLYRFNKRSFYLTFLGDWTSRKDTANYEEFIVANNGGGNIGIFNGGWEFLYKHKAPRSNHLDPVIDHGGLLLNVGILIDTLGTTPFKNLKINANGLVSFGRDRSISSNYDTPAGVEGAIGTTIWRASFNYSHYQRVYQSSRKSHEIPTGEPLYGARYFDRFDISAKPLDTDKLFLDVKLSFIFLEDGFDSRQCLTLVVPFSVGKIGSIK